MAIELPPLPYKLDALEPYMSKKTLSFHYNKHHKHYVDTVNELIEGTALEGANLEDILWESVDHQGPIFNNAAQAWNHTFFWNCMTEKKSKPSTELKRTLAKTFGTWEDFQIEFQTQAKELFGSGWTWLVKDRSGKLVIKSMSNAGNPLAEIGETPLLTCDVWEHAYYLDTQNDRKKFLDNFWHVVDWEFVEANLEKGLKNLLEKPNYESVRSRGQVGSRMSLR